MLGQSFQFNYFFPVALNKNEMLIKVVFSFLCIIATFGEIIANKISDDVKNPAKFHPAYPLWDSEFCLDVPDFESFPHPDNCHEYFMCYGNDIFEMECAVGELFDAWGGFCDDADLVFCKHDDIDHDQR